METAYKKELSKFEIFQAEYKSALEQRDLVSQYEILRFVQKHPEFFSAIEEVESVVLTDIPEIPLDLKAIEAELQSERRVARAIKSWNALARKYETPIRLVFSLWPAVAMILFALITYNLLNRPYGDDQFRRLLFLDYAIFGSVVIICTTRLWQMMGGTSDRNRKGFRRGRFTAGAMVGAISGFAFVCAALLVLPTGRLFNFGDERLHTVMTQAGSFDDDGKEQVPLQSTTAGKNYAVFATRDRSNLPIAVSVYDKGEKLIARGVSSDGEALVDFRARPAESYKVQLEALGSANPAGEKWETKMLELKSKKR